MQIGNFPTYTFSKDIIKFIKTGISILKKSFKIVEHVWMIQAN